MNVHSEGSTGLLSGSAKMAGMDEPREVDLCVPPNSRLVLVAEATLVAAPQLAGGVVLQHSGNSFSKVWEAGEPIKTQAIIEGKNTFSQSLLQ